LNYKHSNSAWIEFTAEKEIIIRESNERSNSDKKPTVADDHRH
jgi:hypothetical protein